MRKESEDEKNQFKKQAQSKRNSHESRFCGGFIKIFPDENDDYYDKFLTAANQIFEKFTGSRNNRMLIDEVKIDKPKIQRINSAREAMENRFSDDEDKSYNTHLKTPRMTRYKSSNSSKKENIDAKKREKSVVFQKKNPKIEMNLRSNIDFSNITASLRNRTLAWC